MTQFDRPYITA